MEIGSRIKTLRESLHISQVVLADRLNVSKQTLYKYENNIITNIPSNKIELAAKILNVTPAYLMGWEENIPEHRPVSIAEPYESQSTKCKTAINLFNELNDEGQERAIDNMMLLKKVYPRMHEPLLNAAHERTDIEITDEMRQHDDDMMDDENF